jgi:hypothetical protein
MASQMIAFHIILDARRSPHNAPVRTGPKTHPAKPKPMSRPRIPVRVLVPGKPCQAGHKLRAFKRLLPLTGLPSGSLEKPSHRHAQDTGKIEQPASACPGIAALDDPQHIGIHARTPGKLATRPAANNPRQCDTGPNNVIDRSNVSHADTICERRRFLQSRL